VLHVRSSNFAEMVFPNTSVLIMIRCTDSSNGKPISELWVVKKLSDLEMSELRRINDSTVLPLNLAVKTLLLT